MITVKTELESYPLHAGYTSIKDEAQSILNKRIQKKALKEAKIKKIRSERKRKRIHSKRNR
ncbi:gp50 [Sphingomonas phage PAU]|uniref:gp50 n=1 Tax=Sphingomonas phage PAU TaxID=1150991 RepID=UPI0002573137|nr:gp50 [Sphingomonas phage PAU]AFF28048.1 gp50 [Sphingomonas phage PAU]